MIPCGALAAAFAAWRSAPLRLVGFFPRLHAPPRTLVPAEVETDGGKEVTACAPKYDYVWFEPQLWWGGQYSIVLTKAAFLHARRAASKRAASKPAAWSLPQP